MFLLFLSRVEKWVVELLTPSGSLRTMPGQSCPWWVGRSFTRVAWPSPPPPLGQPRLGRARVLQHPYCLCFPAMVFSALFQSSTCDQVPQHSVQVPRICLRKGADQDQSLCPALLLQSQQKHLQNLCQPQLQCLLLQRHHLLRHLPTLLSHQLWRPPTKTLPQYSMQTTLQFSTPLLVLLSQPLSNQAQPRLQLSLPRQLQQRRSQPPRAPPWRE